MDSRIVRTLATLCVLIAVSGSPAIAQTAPTLDQILKEISNYDGGVDSAPFWRLRDYVYAHKDAAETRTECEARLLAFLATDATPVAKMAICRHLRIIGGERSVAVLAPMLLDPRSADMALYALQKIPGTGADQALLQAMPKVDGAMKTALIAALGDRKSGNAVPALLPMLKSKGEFAAASALALGEIGGDAACNALLPALAVAEPEGRSLIASSLLKCAESYSAAGNERAAGAVYEKILAATALPVPLRKGAMLGRISTSGARAEAILIGLLKGSDPDMQEVAISKIKDTVKPEGIGAVCSMLPHLAEGPRIQALAVLSGYPKERVLPSLLQAAGSDSQAVRIAAYQGLESVGDVSALKLLLEAAAKNRGAEQNAARNAVALLKGRPVDEGILSMMAQNPPEDLHVELLQAISERRIFQGKAAVAKDLGSGVARIRIQSLRSLRTIGTPSDIPAVLDFLVAGADDAEQSEAINTTAALALKINNPNGRANLVKERLAREKEPNARIRLFRVLGRIGDDSALPALRAELAGANQDVVDAAARTILSWPTTAARDDILNLAQKSPNETHRLLALQALLRIIRSDRYRKPEAAVADLRQAYVLASRSEEKRLILGALPNFICPEALELAGTMLGDSSVKAEAQAAIDKMKPRTVEKKH